MTERDLHVEFNRAVNELACLVPGENFLLAQALSDQARKAFDEQVHRQEEEIAWLQKELTTDPLTGLPNRRGMLEKLRTRLSVVSREQDKRLMLAFVDLDGFKEVNDGLGHDVGDKALIEAGRRLQHAFRKVDAVGLISGEPANDNPDHAAGDEDENVARLGGDEMVVIAMTVKDGTTPEQLTEIVTQRVRNALDDLYFVKPETGAIYPIGASVGTAFRTSEDIDETGDLNAVGAAMLKEADENMYADKAGKDARLEIRRQNAEEKQRRLMPLPLRYAQP